jgi:hypothetical protein
MVENTWGLSDRRPIVSVLFPRPEFEKFYKEEKRTAKIAIAFSIRPFLLPASACSADLFATEQRARRSACKVLGSSIQELSCCLPVKS